MTTRQNSFYTNSIFQRHDEAISTKFEDQIQLIKLDKEQTCSLNSTGFWERPEF